jgi:hypothetical protein
MSRSSTPGVRYHVLVYVILALATVGCGGSADREGDRTTALRNSELLQRGESATVKAKACGLLRRRAAARAAGARRLSARPKNSLHLTVCEWHGGRVRSVELLVDSAPALARCRQRLASLAGRAHHDLVHAHVSGARDRVHDRVGDVLGPEHLPDLLACPLHRLAHHRVPVVAL